MNRISLPPTNDFCPQTLFLYGTYGEGGEPDFGLFCWFSYLWDSQLGVMACIGGEKLTKERIHKNRVFSANLVTEELLPLADYFGNTDGHSPDKMNVDVAIERGQVLDVPVLAAAPVILELEATQFIPLDGGEVMLCKIHNVLQDARLSDASRPLSDRLAAVAPVSTTCERYFSWNGADMGNWGEPGKAIR
ncbi:MAG: flavin reductase family protein [Clostridia bacterium]|nr:flavin reductase family protein [Clostridia bacterium]